METVLITGANKGIGFEVAKQLAKGGYFTREIFTNIHCTNFHQGRLCTNVQASTFSMDTICTNVHCSSF
ncbi:hypothetical protein ACUNWD_14985 [Sunxiuqinia sp. A32]|uniref:hypothetical protein n=1 Tax=Sunxiuqinia sp. A32 TaxID=3461496 RepID=UPI004045589F